ncbi:hypothetical protein [Marinilactibacillus piezotolerans]|uniref:hypothetical protein n=1 Tax=Marinilactibacillus piezotolerans TaxID=258723 RepID=UPI0009B041CE|nr:hypothetical protein [Marinilactibacillus piezotolerans]
MASLAAYTGVIIFWIILLGVVIVVGGGLIMGVKTKPLKAGIAVAGILIIAIAGFFTMMHINSASFQRAKRQAVTEYDTDSVYREMKVVGRDGDVIYETEGSYDIEYTENRLRWIDENGMVQLVYLGDSATVIVNEVEMPDTAE